MIDKKIKENLLNKIIKSFKEEKRNIEKANKIDKKYYNMKVNVEKLIEISEKLKETEIIEKKVCENTIVIHNGNPYITYILAIKAICNKTNIKICVNEKMLGTNLIIVKIINEILEKMKIRTKLEILRKLEIEALRNIKNKKIIVLGDKSEYSRLLRLKLENVQYCALFNISLYVGNDELQELQNNIIEYCIENFIEIEVYEAEDVKDAIEQIKADNEGEKVMLLTKESIDLNEIKAIEKRTGIEISINRNILKNLEYELINREIL